MANPRCPLCGAETRLVNGKNGQFYSCVTWRDTGCKGSVNVPQTDQPPAQASPFDIHIERLRMISTIASGIYQTVYESLSKPELPSPEEVSHHARMVADRIITDCRNNPPPQR